MGRRLSSVVVALVAAASMASCGGSGGAGPGSEGVLILEYEASPKSLIALDADGTDPRRVADLGGTQAFWWWSPDGSLLAFGQEGGGLAIVDVATAHVVWRGLGGFVAGAAWSHDGKWLAVEKTTHPDAPGDLVVLAARGGEERRLAGPAPTDSDFRADPTWSADDRLISYGFPARVVRVDTGASEPLPLDTDEQTAMTLWSPDGEHVAQMTSGQVLVGTLGSRASVPVGPGWTFGWSPDGRWLLLMPSAAGGEFGSYSSLVAVSADGSDRRVLADVTESGVVGAAWSPASDAVAFVTAREQVVVVPLDGSRARTVLSIDHDKGGGFVWPAVQWRRASVGGEPIDLPRSA